MTPEDKRCAMQARVIAETLSWIGTPYRHQAAQKGLGTDCLGLVRGVYQALYGAMPAVPPYPPVVTAGEPLLNAAADYLVPTSLPEAGDVVIFRLRRGGQAVHCGILIAPNRFVHALAGRAVTATGYAPYWCTRTAAAFRFPEAP